jgi:hypothetical protein
MRLVILLAFVFAVLFGGGLVYAAKVKVVPPYGANWSAYAERYLIVWRENRPFSAAKDKPTRCVRANNYGCMWQPAQSNWPGTPGPDGTDGAHDGEGTTNGHAIFSHPKWSVAAAMRWFERKTSGGTQPKSARQLAESYMPWCDTQGSAAVKADFSGRLWGRSCANGKKPPAGFSGPRCQRPASGEPSPAQCQACNCPPEAARFWLNGTSHGIDDKLELFDGTGKPTATLQSLIGWKTAYETGKYKPNEALMAEAAAAFEPARR